MKECRKERESGERERERVGREGAQEGEGGGEREREGGKREGGRGGTAAESLPNRSIFSVIDLCQPLH